MIFQLAEVFQIFSQARVPQLPHRVVCVTRQMRLLHGFSHSSRSKKSAKLGSDSSSELLPESSPSTRRAYVIMQRQFQQFFDRSCMPILVPHSAHCAGRGDLTGTVWGGSGRARCCATTGALVGVAQCLVRQWIHAMRHSGRLLDKFTIFLHDWVDSALRSILRPGWHIVDNGSGMFILVLLVLTHLSLCSHDCRQSGNLYIISTSLLYFQQVQCSDFLRESIFWSPRALTPVSARGLGGWR